MTASSRFFLYILREWTRMYMCRISTCTQVFFTFYHLKYLQVFQSSINSKSPDSQQKVALLSISMFGCFLTLGWHPVRNFIQFLVFSFSGPTKKRSKNPILPQKETKMCSSNHSLPMMLRDFWIPPSASFIASLLWFLVDIWYQFSYKSIFLQIFVPTKNGPRPKEKMNQQENLPPRWRTKTSLAPAVLVPMRLQDPALGVFRKDVEKNALPETNGLPMKMDNVLIWGNS